MWVIRAAAWYFPHTKADPLLAASAAWASKRRPTLLGGPPDPLQKTIPSPLPLTIRMRRPPTLALRGFQTFWPKPILTPVILI